MPLNYSDCFVGMRVKVAGVKRLRKVMDFHEEVCWAKIDRDLAGQVGSLFEATHPRGLVQFQSLDRPPKKRWYPPQALELAEDDEWGSAYEEYQLKTCEAFWNPQLPAYRTSGTVDFNASADIFEIPAEVDVDGSSPVPSGRARMQKGFQTAFAVFDQLSEGTKDGPGTRECITDDKVFLPSVHTHVAGNSVGLQYTAAHTVEPAEVPSDSAHAARGVLRVLRLRQKYVRNLPRWPEDTPTITREEKKVAADHVMAQISGEAAVRGVDNRRFVFNPRGGQPPGASDHVIKRHDGVAFAEAGGRRVGEVASAAEFCEDFVTVLRLVFDRIAISFVEPRLQGLELQFDLYSSMNGTREAQAQRQAGGRDFFDVTKVDNQVNHSAYFSQPQLLRLIRQKMKEDAELSVLEVDSQPMKLREIFLEAGVDDEDLHSAKLGMGVSMGDGSADTFGRFDRFNLKYNPFGNEKLRTVFLRRENMVDGRYLAELTKESFEIRRKDCGKEIRISVYGKSLQEWSDLASWFKRYEMSTFGVRWLVQVPRLYTHLKRAGFIKTYDDILLNIFQPLFEVTANPSRDLDLHFLLQQVGGFDCVGDEAESHGTDGGHESHNFPDPEDYDVDYDPPYGYWLYFLWANITSLNAFRMERGLCTFQFRPSGGQAGHISHLASCFLLADSISHGIRLVDNAVLEYLFYLAEVGIAMSPLASDILTVPLLENPFHRFFKRGLKVSLASNNPMMVHLTDYPLMEEYALAARIWKLSAADLCEVARNSVLHSCFEEPLKQWWLGDQYAVKNDAAKTNVPDCRVAFRSAIHTDEWSTLVRLGS